AVAPGHGPPGAGFARGGAAVVALMLGPSALERLKAPPPGAPPTAVPSASARDDVDAETLAAFEAWAGLEPLEDTGSGYSVDEDLTWEGDDADLDGDFDLGETL
ncbi:hypothetical protein ACLEQD_42545, partial [Corallococcus sp. 4LFB]